MEKYEERLFKEFLETQKIEINKKNQDYLFKNWLEDKSRILNLYEQFLETMDFIPRRGVVELDKGNNDSVLLHTPTDSLGIIVSDNYAKQERIDKKIVGVSGQIKINKDNILLNYNKKERILDFINFYITQFPCNQDTIDTLIDIALKGKHIFIGTYGNLKDKNMNEKLRKLYDLKEEIEAFTGKNVQGEVVTTSRYYLAAITPKLKYKKRN